METIMQSNEIQLIPIEWLRHHPDNPRKDLGDLTELADSIKANGILQNLTVVFADPDREPDSKKTNTHLLWVVIGNRRMEAAKIAGLTELPCVVSDMDEKTQVSTMLTENMQRSDLTVYEQAQGFQMMMDLGYTEKEISEKTGFSKKTVKDRIKLTKLNKKEFTNAVNRGANLIEMIEVTKLESKEAQKEVLQAAGTENFRQRMQRALKIQEYEKGKKTLLPTLNELMKEIPSDERWGSKWEKVWGKDFDITGTVDELKEHLQKEIMTDPDLECRYYFDEYSGPAGCVGFYRSKPKAPPMTEEQKTERQKSKLRNKHLKKVKSFWAQAYELRKDFVKNYSTQNGQSAATLSKIIVRRTLDQTERWSDGKIPQRHEWNDAYLREVLDLPEKPVELPGQEDVRNSWDKKYKTIWQQVDGTSIPNVRYTLAWAVAGGLYWPDSQDHGLYDSQDGKYLEGSSMDNGVTKLYDFLMEIGYQLSDMEKQLLDGTHECYQMEEI